MRGILLLSILNIKSSYAEDIEEPVGEGDVPDTVQWWFTARECWRVRTFALDHDIHTHSVASGGHGMLPLARANNVKHYGDSIVAEHVVQIDDTEDADEVRRVLEAAGLEPRLAIERGRFVFWKPDDELYVTQTTPD